MKFVWFIHINSNGCAGWNKNIYCNNINNTNNKKGKKRSSTNYKKYLLRSLSFYQSYTVVTRLGSAINIGVLFVASLARHKSCKCIDVATFDNSMSIRIQSSLLTGCGIASSASSKKFLQIKNLMKY